MIAIDAEKNGSGSESNSGERRYTWFIIRYLSPYWGWHVLDNTLEDSFFASSCLGNFVGLGDCY